MTTTSIKSYDKNGLRLLMQQLGQPAYRARQLAAWLYGPTPTESTRLAGEQALFVSPAALVTSFEQMTDLPRSLREKLAQTCTLDTPRVLRRLDSQDGSRKYLLQLAGGTVVETVAIPSGSARLTVCFSTQAGCAMGCVFCATGRSGLVRSLGAGEMVDQLLVAAHDFASDPPLKKSWPTRYVSAATRPVSAATRPGLAQTGTFAAVSEESLALHVTNAVAMGQGEPFANYNAALGALRIINDERLLGIGARHLTVSTCGLVDGIHRFAEEPEQFTLAVSLHSAVQATRDRLLPGLVNQPLALLHEELCYYANITGRRPSLEYALMAGINDTAEELRALINFARGRGALNFHVNLIALNEGGDSQLRASGPERIEAFAAGLREAGIDANLRVSRGQDIRAACGQLAENSAAIESV